MKKKPDLPKSKKRSKYTRRQFVGGMAAGASLLQLAPYLSIAGCQPPEPDPFTVREYHRLAMGKYLFEEIEPTRPRITVGGISDNKINGIRINVTFPGFHSFKTEANVKPHSKKETKKFHRISIEQLGRTNLSGKPDLPFLGLLVHIPKFLKYKPKVSFSTESISKIFERKIAYPAQVDFFDNVNHHGNYGYLEYDDQFYNTNTLFPQNDHVEITEPFDIGHSRFVLVKIWPILFNPRRRKLKARTHITIDFELEEKSKMEPEYYLESPFLPQHLDSIPQHERIINPWAYYGNISNLPDYIEIDGNDVVTSIMGISINLGDNNYIEEGKELLIIYGEGDSSKKEISFQSLATGLYESKYPNCDKPNIISYKQIVNSGEISISDFIRNRQRRVSFDGQDIFYPKLKDVILLGDLDLIPCESREMSLGMDDGNLSNAPDIVMNYQSDYYSGTLRNQESLNDIVIPDICIGRIPARNLEEAELMVGNIIQFSNNPQLEIRNRLSFLSYFQDTGKDGLQCNGVASTDYLQTMEYIRTRLPVLRENISTVYDIQDRDYINTGLKYRDGEDVLSSVNFPQRKDIKELIRDDFRSGSRIIVHRDHGYMNGWSRPNFKIPDLWSVFRDYEDEISPSIVFSINCLSGHFAGEQSGIMPGRDFSSFTEVLLRGPVLPDGSHKNLRCPAVVSSVMESPTFHNDWFLKGLMEGIYGGIFQEEVNKTPGKEKLGDVVNLARMLMFTCMDGADFNMYENEVYHILGDPTIRI